MDRKRFSSSLLLVAGMSAMFFGAALSAPEPTDPNDNAEFEQSPLPDIVARTYRVKVLERSQSGRVYLFEDIEERGPETNRIVLMRRGGVNAMAFRVLRTYDEKTKFAASRVRRYSGIRNLNISDPLLAIEKVGDHFAKPTAQEMEADEEDLDELEEDLPDMVPDAPPPTADISEDVEDEGDFFDDGESEFDDEETGLEVGTDIPADDALVEDEFDEDEGEDEEFADDFEEVATSMDPPQIMAYDPELDRTTSPAPDRMRDDDSINRFIADEETLYDRDDHWLMVQTGMMRAIAAPRESSGSTYFGAIGLRYGYTPVRNLFTKKKNLQDSLTVEGGVFLYKVLNYEIDGDAYTIIPLVGTLRYNLFLSEAFGFFGYLGFVNNFVSTAFGVEAAPNGPQAVANLGSILPALGGGMFFRFGPRWFARLDAGLDMLGLGVVLRF